MAQCPSAVVVTEQRVPRRISKYRVLYTIFPNVCKSNPAKEAGRWKPIRLTRVKACRRDLSEGHRSCYPRISNADAKGSQDERVTLKCTTSRVPWTTKKNAKIGRNTTS